MRAPRLGVAAGCPRGVGSGSGSWRSGSAVAWSQLVMPAGFAVMALRFAVAGARRGRGPRAAAARWAFRAAALAVAAAAFLLGQGRRRAARSRPCCSSSSPAAFLLGAPVFVAMAGVAMVLFFRERRREPIAAVPTATFNLVSSRDAPRHPAPHRGRLRARRGRRRAAAGARLQGASSAGCRAGVAVMARSVCALFTTFTGASGVTILALGGLLLPSLLEDGYPEGFSRRARHRRRLPRPALPAVAPGDPLRGGGPGAAIEDLFIGGLVPGPAHDRAGRRLRRLHGREGQGAAPGVPARARRCGALGGEVGPRASPRSSSSRSSTGFATIVEAAALAAAYALVVELVDLPGSTPFQRPAARPRPRRHAGRRGAHPARRGARR